MSASSDQTENGADPRLLFGSSGGVAVHVSSLEKAEHFYGAVLGFRLVARTARQLEFDTGGLRLFVNLDSRPLPSYVPSFDVIDREAAREYLEGAGCKTVHISSHPGLYYMRDPFGMLFDIAARSPGESPAVIP
jgi:catechol 2,3-dioxygenase-like lactoylglutathione lyase family enzyme